MLQFYRDDPVAILVSNFNSYLALILNVHESECFNTMSKGILENGFSSI